MSDAAEVLLVKASWVRVMYLILVCLHLDALVMALMVSAMRLILSIVVAMGPCCGVASVPLRIINLHTW